MEKGEWKAKSEKIKANSEKWKVESGTVGMRRDVSMFAKVE